MTWELVVPIPPHPGFGLGRHAPPVQALRFGHRRANSRVEAARLAAKAPASADGSTRHGDEQGEGGEAVNAPCETSTRHVNAPREAEAWGARRSRLRAFLEKGRGYRAWLDEGVGRSTKHLAEREGVSRPRVCQLLVLTRLAPEIQADIDDATRTTPVPTERDLRALADLPAVEQVWKYMEATGALVHVADSRKVARLAGFQHLFARARELNARWATGEYRTLGDLAKTEGVTAQRVSQLLNLLLLAPEIIVALDVPKEEAPRLAEREIRRLARIVDHGEQRAAFGRMVRAVLPVAGTPTAS